MVHLLGAKSFPNCALFHTAEDNTLGFFSLVLDTVRRDFYIDNCLNSMNSEIDTTGLINELTMPLRRGRFELRKWLTTFLAVSFDVSVSCADSSVSLGHDNEEALHVLGGKWNYVEAEPQTHISRRSKPFTGRVIFSVAISVYECLGMFTRFVILAESILQDLCRAGIGWDTPWTTRRSSVDCLGSAKQ